MMHGHDPSGRLRESRRRRGGALARLLLALAIMLIAVLPHATLAASALHMGSVARGAAPSPHHGARAGEPAAPCHDDDASGHQPTSTMPACCILGCGLLAEAPATGGLAVAAAWRASRATAMRPGQGTTIEPAERPPRRRLAQIRRSDIS